MPDILYLYGVSLLPLFWIVLTTRQRALQIVVVLALCYPIGEILQTLIIGPRWARHYLSDVGFVPLMVLLVVILRAFQERGAVWLEVLRAGESDYISDWVLPPVLFFLGGALGHEAYQWSSGHGDLLDAMLEMFSASATAALLSELRRLLWQALPADESNSILESVKQS